MQIDYAKLLSRPEWQFDQAKLDSALFGRRVLITGAGGSIGSALSRRIAAAEPEFLGMVGHSELPIFRLLGDLRGVPGRREYRIANAGGPGMLDILREWRPDLIIHAAAHKHVGLMEAQPRAAFENNVEATVNLSECAAEFGCDNFVFISTDKAANPTSYMGASKRLAEAVLLTKCPNATICRFGNVLGSSGSLVAVVIARMLVGQRFTINDPMMKRYFITPNEAVGLVLSAALLDKNPRPAIFTLDMGEQEKITDVTDRLSDQMRTFTGYDVGCDVGVPGSGEKIEEDLLNPGESLHDTLIPGVKRIDGKPIRAAVASALEYCRVEPADMKILANGLTIK